MADYSAKVLDHFHAPRNGGAFPDPDAVGKGNLNGRAPYTEIYAKFDGDRIGRTGFTTFGCGASIACGSVLTELITGQSVDDCRRITAHQILEALDGLPAEKQFCASIAISALQDLLRQWDARHASRASFSINEIGDSKITDDGIIRS